MITLNVHEVKAHFSRYLNAVENGETVLLCRRNVPVAELRPLPKSTSQERPLGLARDRGQELPPAFFEPLPDEILSLFDGEGH